MLKKVAIGVGVVVLLFLGIVASRPDRVTIARVVTANASAAALYPLVNDYHRFGEWSPWEKLDPAMVKKYEGEPSGKGSAYYWKGNDKVGEGRMTNLGGKENERIEMKLDFISPFPAENDTFFDFKPAGAGTEVTWTVVLHQSFMGKMGGLFMDMDKMIGDDFAKGLADLKTLGEAAQAKADADKKKAEEEAKAKAAAEAAAAAAAAAPAAPAATAKK